MIFSLILLLIIIDSTSKIIINLLFMDTTFSVFNGYLAFRPFLNTSSMSIFNGLFIDLNVSLNKLILINLILLILMIPIYKYLRSINFKSLYLSSILVLIASACISSTIDRVFWKGSLDFLLISHYIIDFKDIYIFLSIAISIIYILKNIAHLAINYIAKKL